MLPDQLLITDHIEANGSRTFGHGDPERRQHLRICYISETLHAGVGRHILEIICLMAQRGHEIHLLYSPIRMEETFLRIITKQPNVHCTAIPMPRAVGWGDVSAFAQIKRHVRKSGPFDIIHGHSSKGGGYARLLRLFGAAPIIYTPHAFITFSRVVSPRMRLIYRMLEAGLVRLTDRVICVSRAEHEHARGLGIAADRLAVISIGADAIPGLPREAARGKLGLSATQVVVGYIGRMDDQKAPDALVSAMRQLLPELPELTLVMVGDGPKRTNLEASLLEAGLSDRALWFDFTEGHRYIAGFDMLVVPSIYEGFARVLIEALHAGLPIVSTPVGGAHETITPGVNGFIVPHNATDKMAQAIRLLASRPSLRRSMGEASREHASRFAIPDMVNALEALYLDVLTAQAHATKHRFLRLINVRGG